MHSESKLRLALAVLAGLAVFGCAKAPQPAPTREPLVLADPRSPDAVPSYLIVCPQKAVADVMPLARWRSAHGQTVRIAAAEKVYSAFGEGAPAVEPIRAFVRSLRQAGSGTGRVRFRLLVGTGDPKNPEGLYLPTCTVRARFYSTKMPSDRLLVGDGPYAGPAGGGVPDIAVGRLPARSPAELRVIKEFYKAFCIAYEQIKRERGT